MGGGSLPFVLLKNVKHSPSHLHLTRSRNGARAGKTNLIVSEQLGVGKCSPEDGVSSGTKSTAAGETRTCTTGINTRDVAVKLSLLRRPKWSREAGLFLE